MSCKTCDIQIKKSDALDNCQDPKIGHFSLKCFLKDAFSAENGITLDGLNFKLGSALTEDTEISNPDSKDFILEGDFLNLAIKNSVEVVGDPKIAGFANFANFPEIKAIAGLDFDGNARYVFGEFNSDTGAGNNILIVPTQNVGLPNNGLVSFASTSVITGVAVDAINFSASETSSPTGINATIDVYSNSGGDARASFGVRDGSTFESGRFGADLDSTNMTVVYGATGENDYFSNLLRIDDNTISIKHNAGSGALTNDPNEVLIDSDGFTVRDNSTGNPVNIPFSGLTAYANTAAAAADGGLLSGTLFKVTNGDGTSAVHIKG